MSAGVRCSGVVVRFGSQAALDGVDWTIAPGDCVGLLGSSGSGKTTLLRVIAGLERCTSGTVTLTAENDGGTPVASSIGMVFQHLALWPHLTARRHLECVLAHLPRPQRHVKVEETLRQVRLPEAAWDRRPAELSGGEGQRLALARALAPEPELLLLDEPLAHVDAALRAELLSLLREVTQARRRTTLYVTHHAAEAFALCQTVAAIERGRIVQSGPPDLLFWRPANERVAALTGPVLTPPVSWLERGWLTSKSLDAARAGLIPGCADLLVRPQQLHLRTTADSGWRVERSLPHEAGWLVSVAREDAHWQVASQCAFPAEVFVEIELSPPPGVDD